MRDWALGRGDPLSLTLAADFRLGEAEYANDINWELELGGGDPPALAARTTYGLRARSMRLFPHFVSGERKISDPVEFTSPPCLRRFTPGFLLFDFSLLPGLAVTSEFWVPSSQTLACRLTFNNQGAAPQVGSFEICGVLNPMDGQSLSPLRMQSIHVLAGQTSDLAPILFMTGGPQPGPGPYPALMVDFNLAPGARRQVTWVHAATNSAQDSFELARRTAARPWDAERARVELLHASQTVEIETGDMEWDAAFALSQRTAFSLFFPASLKLPFPSFVNARQPDHDFFGDSGETSPTAVWNKQSPLTANYLASLLPGASELAEGLLRNFLSVQRDAGRHGGWLDTPLLAGMAWKVYEFKENKAFLTEVFPPLLAFYRNWFTPANDRDGDGFPEWDHPCQTGFEDSPMFNIWDEWGLGVEISAVESPALTSMLYNECRALIRMADLLGGNEDSERLQFDAATLRAKTEECWDAQAAIYHMRDRETHASPAERRLAVQNGNGTVALNLSFKQPRRLLVHIRSEDPDCHPKIVIRGRAAGKSVREEISRTNLTWVSGRAVYTSQVCFTRLTKMDVRGLGIKDDVRLSALGFEGEDHTLILPIWAGIPHPRRALTMVTRSLFEAGRYYHPYGISACPFMLDSGREQMQNADSESVCQGVHMPVSQMLGEGLLVYGLRAQAAQLTARLMSGIIANLKKRHAFYSVYHADSGSGMGERNAVTGLAPLGLFLQTLGVRFLDGGRVLLSGKNPFPWPVTVKYRGLAVTRRAEQTEIVFPDGQRLGVDDPTDAILCPE